MAKYQYIMKKKKKNLHAYYRNVNSTILILAFSHSQTKLRKVNFFPFGLNIFCLAIGQKGNLINKVSFFLEHG